MSATILKVIEAGGFDLSTEEDAIWLLSVETQFAELIEKAHELVDSLQEARDKIAEEDYLKVFG